MTDLQNLHHSIPPGRGIYCNRTLNLRSVRAIGYDMDYTLIHYEVREWERCAYEFVRDRLAERGWPVSQLQFEPDFVIRGLIIDQELGNLVKANRFGYVKRASHGTKPLTHEEQRNTYTSTIIDLAEPRWVFLNTLFSLSEGCIYAQLVDLLDAGKLPEILGYKDLHDRVSSLLNEAHMEGQIKSLIMEQPERFVVLDELAPRALLDQRQAGKKLLLITNSDWTFTSTMMTYAYDRYLPGDMSWRDLFDLVVVGARKPAFFFEKAPFFEIIDDDGLLRPAPAGVKPGACYMGGNAKAVEQGLNIAGSDILYVGDHIYSDVHVSKGVRRWRTAVVLREIEDEVLALRSFADRQRELDALMAQKERAEFHYSQIRLELQRRKHGAEPSRSGNDEELQTQVEELRATLVELDDRIGPAAQAAGKLSNDRWGLLLRTGNDKSHLARQIERHADVYTSRVSNFVFETPFVFLRSPRGSLPHG